MTLETMSREAVSIPARPYGDPDTSVRLYLCGNSVHLYITAGATETTLRITQAELVALHGAIGNILGTRQ